MPLMFPVYTDRLTPLLGVLVLVAPTLSPFDQWFFRLIYRNDLLVPEVVGAQELDFRSPSKLAQSFNALFSAINFQEYHMQL